MLAYLQSHEVWEVFQEYDPTHVPLQELCHYLLPLLPRLYSIANSPLCTPHEIHLTVSYLQYTTSSQSRTGVGSYFLCQWAKAYETPIPFSIQPAEHFSLPPHLDIPIIMIAAGTGVAPFRAFMQERQKRQASGGHWLFFGERQRAYDFYYEEYWVQLQEQRLLRLDTAFSRDHAHKVYVQHKLQEQAAEVWQWICAGAYLYVCGDADNMAKDVDQALCHVIQQQGSMSEESAKKYLKTLRQQKRYLLDVY